MAPWRIGVCLAIGFVIASLIPDIFWDLTKWDVSTAVCAGILTFNGLVMALSWGAFARIYESICSPSFAAYLRNNKLLGDYLFHIGYAHAAQTFAVAASAAALVLLLVDPLPLVADRVLFALMLGSSAYAILEAGGAVTIMNDLIWNRSLYDEATTAEPKKDGETEPTDNIVNYRPNGE